MKKEKIVIILLTISLIFSCKKETANWIETTNSKPWQIKGAIEIKQSLDSVDVTIELSNKLQEIDGFGACFNELGWEALSYLSEKERQTIFKEFFLPDSGCNFSICRMPIGANDYAKSWYSLNDTDKDFEMKNFNIDRDMKCLVPYIKEAMKLRPDLKIWGSPWCPPAWMKKNKHYACAPHDSLNGLNPKGAGKEGTDLFVQDSLYLSSYALYFAKYIKAYKEQGINVYAVHVQNEPNSCQVFPSCIWTAKGLNDFIGKYLGPRFEKEGLNTEIWLGTIERPSVEKVDTVLTDPLSSKYVKGVGFQWAGKDAIPGVHQKYPDIRLMETESECGDGSNDWKAAEHTFGLMKHYLGNGANAYMYWNPILEKTGASKWGWKQNSLISVDTIAKKAIYNPEFYLFKHLTHFVKPGAKRISTLGKFNDILVFENPDGEVVVLVANLSDETKEIVIKAGDKMFMPKLEGKSFSTICMKFIK